ncbi:MAG: hypothetical protein R6X08_09135 [Desulfosalsimonadaceae bacterium]
MGKRPVTPRYLAFYILFLPDTWQAAMGLLFALLLRPYATSPEMELFKRILIFVMLATIGYTITRIPARWITRKLKQLILE